MQFTNRHQPDPYQRHVASLNLDRGAIAAEAREGHQLLREHIAELYAEWQCGQCGAVIDEAQYFIRWIRPLCQRCHGEISAAIEQARQHVEVAA